MADQPRSLPSRLGLPSDASEAEIDARRKRVENYLDEAPEELRPWAETARRDLTTPATSPTHVEGPRRLNWWMLLSIGLIGFLLVQEAFIFGEGLWGKGEQMPANHPRASALPSKHPDINGIAPEGAATPKSSEEIAAEAKALEQMVAKEPKNVKARIKLGGAYYSLGRYADAKAQLDQASAIEPSNTEVYYALGFVNLRMTPPNPVGAAAAWNKIVELEPGTDIAQSAQQQLDRLTRNIAAQTAAPSATPSK